MTGFTDDARSRPDAAPLPRTHLLDRLDSTEIAVLTAPRGAGKTALLDRWLQRHHALGERTAWIDAGAWIESIGRPVPAGTGESAAASASAPGTDDAEIPLLLTGVDALVIDGFDGDVAGAGPRLAATIEAAGPSARIAVGSRTGLGRAAGAHHRLSAAATLRLPELRFTPDELGAILADAHPDAGTETTTLVDELTGGLPGLVAAILDELRHAVAQRRPVPGRLQLTRTLRELVDAELDADPGACPDSTHGSDPGAAGPRASLQRLALLPAFGARDEAALGLPDGWTVQHLARAGWLETLPGTGSARSRVPAGLRSALPPLDDATALPLLAAFAQDRIDEDRLDEAWDIAFPRAGAQLAWRIGVTAAARLNTQVLDRIARECLGQPPAWFEPCPYLGWFAAVFTRGEGPGITERIRLIAAMEPTQLAMPAPPPDRILFFAILTVAFRIQGNLERATDCADRVLAIWQDLSRTLAPRDQGVGAWGLNTAGMTYLAANRLAEASACMRTSWEIAVAAGNPPINAVFGGNLVLVQAIRGDLATAEGTLQALRRADPERSPRFMTASAPLVAGMLALERGDLDTARASITTARTLIGDAELWPVYESIAALVDTAAGIPAAAARLERALRSRTEQGDRVVVPRYVRTALALMRLVDPTAMGPDAPNGDAGGAPPPGIADPLESVIPALQHLLRSDPGGALRLSRETGAFDGSREIPRTEAWRTLIAAAAALDSGAATKEVALYLGQAALVAESSRLSLQVRFIPERLRTDLAGIARELQFPAFADLLADVDSTPSLVSELPRIQRPSQREREVLQALATQQSVQAIADELGISVNTAKTQIQRLYRKLGAHTRAEAVRAAVRHGLIEAGEG